MSSFAPDTGRPLALKAGALALAAYVAGVVRQLATVPYPSQDDMAQHIVWFRALLPHSSFPATPIGDFFIGSNGPLFRALYGGAASLGCDPVALAWCVGLLATVATAYAAGRLARACGASGATVALAPAAAILFLSFRDDMPTGTARAIGWPLLMTGWWLLAARRPVGFAGVSAASALVYPPVTVLLLAAGGVERGWAWWRAPSTRTAAIWGAALLLPAAVLVAAMAGHDPWGPSVSLAEARQLPEFGPDGRARFFTDPLDYWLFGARGGLLPSGIHLAWPFILAAIFAAVARVRLPRPLLWFAGLSAGIGLALWLLAHAVLFRLYLPSRFPSYGLGVALMLIGAAVAGRGWRTGRRALVILAAFGPPLVLAAFGQWPKSGIEHSDAPAVMAAMARDRRPGLAGGLAGELDRVPIVLGRATWWSAETALPYKERYRRMMNARLGATVATVASPDPAAVLGWARANGIVLVLLPADLMRRDFRERWTATLDGPGMENYRRAWRARGRSWLWRQRRCRAADAALVAWDMVCLGAQAGTAVTK